MEIESSTLNQGTQSVPNLDEKPQLTDQSLSGTEPSVKSEVKEEPGHCASDEVQSQTLQIGSQLKQESSQSNRAGSSTLQLAQEVEAKFDRKANSSLILAAKAEVKEERKPDVKCEIEDFGDGWHFVGTVFGTMVRKQHGGYAITELIESSPNMYLRLKRGDSSYNFSEIKVYAPDDTFLGTLDRDLDEMLALTMDCGWSKGRCQLGSNPKVYKTPKYKTKEFVDITVEVYLKQDLIDNPYQLWPDDQIERRGLKWLKRRLGDDDEGQEIIGSLLSITRAGKHPRY